MSGSAAGERLSHAKLGPLDFPSLNNITNAAFSAGQAGASSLDLQEHDPPHPAFGKTIKDHQVNGAAEKANILRIVGKCWKVWDQLLVDLASGYGQASLHRILANNRGVPHLPNQEVHPGHKKADRYSDDEPEKVCWQEGLGDGVVSGALKSMVLPAPPGRGVRARPRLAVAEPDTRASIGYAR